MSNLRLAAALAGLTALAAGCGGPGALPEPEPVGQGLTWERFRSQAYMDPEGVFIVDGDVALHDEERLREFFERYVKDGQLIVHTSGGVDVRWNDTQKLNLTYCVSNTAFSSTRHGLVVQAMANATAAWEAVANVDFIHKSDQDANCTASNTQVVFDVRPVDSGGTYYLRAFFPDTPRGARNILIDGMSFGDIAPLSLTGLLRHELGHVLGFGHEHIRPVSGATDPNCFEDAGWRELTSYDPASVMHFPSCNGTGDWSFTLSSLDAQGAAALYGAPGTQPPPPPPPPPGTPTAETASGSLSSGQSANLGPYDVVPNSYFKVVMSGTGNPDLYVSFGTAPTATSFYCRPALSGASETCDVLVPANESKAYVMVKGVTSATYSLDINYLKPSTGGHTVETASGSLSSGQSAYHGPYDVLAGTYFKVVMTGTGNPDLYVNFGAYPTATSFYCRPALSGASETCDVLVPEGQTKAYIMVKSSNTSTYSLSLDYTRPSASGGPTAETASGSLSSGQSANLGPYDVVPNSYFKVVMSGTGNPDLYVSFGTAPTATSFYCRPALSGASETCDVLVPANESKAYVMVKGVTSATYSLDINYVRP